MTESGIPFRRFGIWSIKLHCLRRQVNWAGGDPGVGVGVKVEAKEAGVNVDDSVSVILSRSHHK